MPHHSRTRNFPAPVTTAIPTSHLL